VARADAADVTAIAPASDAAATVRCIEIISGNVGWSGHGIRWRILRVLGVGEGRPDIRERPLNPGIYCGAAAFDLVRVLVDRAGGLLDFVELVQLCDGLGDLLLRGGELVGTAGGGCRQCRGACSITTVRIKSGSSDVGSNASTMRRAPSNLAAGTHRTTAPLAALPL
jgi:hypothetical protein